MGNSVGVEIIINRDMYFERRSRLLCTDIAIEGFLSFVTQKLVVSKAHCTPIEKTTLGFQIKEHIKWHQ